MDVRLHGVSAHNPHVGQGQKYIYLNTGFMWNLSWIYSQSRI